MHPVPGPPIALPDHLSTMRVAVSAAVATITLDRPGRRNAMTTPMVRELHAVLTALGADPDVRVVVLTGAGDRFFCPGADLAPPDDAGPTEDPELPEAWELQVPVLLHEMPQVTIAAINGACAGAGLGWACGCDLRIAASSATFATAFLDVGVAGDMGLPWWRPPKGGGATARDLLLRRGRFDAAEALRVGLVSSLHPPDAFADAVSACVERLVSVSATALRALKANLVVAERTSFADYVQMESERHLRLMGGPDFAAGITAFRERR